MIDIDDIDDRYIYIYTYIDIIIDDITRMIFFTINFVNARLYFILKFFCHFLIKRNF